MKPYVIRSKRLYLRRFQPSDYQDLHEYLSDPEVVRYEPYEAFNLKQSKFEALNRSSRPCYWAVCLNQTNKVIGNLYFNKTTFETYELGFVFNRAYQKQGYAFESCKALLQYAFQIMNVRRVIALCAMDNINSWTLMERLQMRRESSYVQNVAFKKDSQGNPIYINTYQYAILKTEYDQYNTSH